MKTLIKKLYQHSGNQEVINITQAMMIELSSAGTMPSNCNLYDIINYNCLADHEFLMYFMSNYKELKYCLISYSWRFSKSIIPKDILYKFAKDKDSRTRVELANVLKDSSVNGDIFELLSKDKLVGVRKQIANNFSTPDSILYALRQDKSEIVRFSAINMLAYNNSR